MAAGKRHTVAIVVTIIVALLVVSAVALYGLLKAKVIEINPLFIKSTDVVGVDISSYQANVDMEKLADEGMSFVYVKATEGSTSVDERFAENWNNARASRLEAGAYHFFSFDSPGETQARHYIDVVGKLDGCLIPVVDVEYYGDKKENPPAAEDVVRELQSYLDVLEAEYGVLPMIYSSRDVEKAFLHDSFDNYPRWVHSVRFPIWLDYQGSWLVWQYSNRAELEGYSGGEQFIDLNVVNASESLGSLMVDNQK